MPSQERPRAAAAALQHIPLLVLVASALLLSVAAFNPDHRSVIYASLVPVTLLSAAMSLGVPVWRRGHRPAALTVVAGARCRSQGR